MREIHFNQIVEAVKKLCMDANYYLGDDVKDAIRKALEKEDSPTARDILQQILENAEIAEKEQLAICQDTGFAVFFVELGQDVKIVGGNYYDAFLEGVRQGYKEGYLRKSIVFDPVFERKNTGDNTPCVVHTEIVPGDKMRIVFTPKGGGSENMSFVSMMPPAKGAEGIKQFVVECMEKAGGKPCPPVIIGVGIGGTFEKCAQLAKKALLREPLGKPNPDPRYAKLEKEILEEVNKTGIGPMGLGGRTTALAVHIEVYPCHIATMPCAVNMCCHASRHKEIIL